MRINFALTAVWLLRLASADEIDDRIECDMQSPNATATRKITGFNVSQEFPGEETDGWSLYVKLRTGLEYTQEETNGPLIQSWIGITPPDSLKQNDTHIRADDSWSLCLGAMSFMSSQESVDPDCGNVLPSCMDWLRKMAKSGSLCEPGGIWLRNGLIHHEDRPAECKFEHGIYQPFSTKTLSAVGESGSSASLNVHELRTGVLSRDEGESIEETYSRRANLVYFVSVDWSKNNGTDKAANDTGSEQPASSFRCMRPDTFAEGSEPKRGASSYMQLPMLLGGVLAAAVTMAAML